MATTRAAAPAWHEPLDVAFTARLDGSTQRCVLLRLQGFN